MSDFLSREPRPMWRALATLSATVYAVAFLGAQARAPRPGDPLAGISTGEFAEFRLGLDDFLEVETAEEGLGPAFNGTSCAICHNIPAVGGFGTIPKSAPVGRNEEGELTPLHASGETLPPAVFRADPRLSGHRFRTRRSSSRAASRFRCSAPVSSKPSLTRRSSRWRTRRTATATASAGGRRASSTSKRGRFALDGSAGKRSTRRCSRLARTPIATRWASRTICFPTNWRPASRGTACGSAIRFPIRKTSAIPGRTAAASTTSRASCASWRRSRALTPDAAARSGEQVFTAIGCATCHVPVLATGRNPNPLFDRIRRSRCSRTCCSTTSARATASRRVRRLRPKFARRRCGVSGPAGRSCTTGQRRRSNRRSGARGGSRAHACRVRPVDRSRQSGAARVPEDAVRPRRLSRPPDR